MKKILFVIGLLIISSSTVRAQSVGIGTSMPEASAQLDISGTDKGILIPRMTTTSIGNIPNPAKGLMVYDTLMNALMVNMGTALSPDWRTIAAQSNWNLHGNSGTNPGNHFIGTTDNAPLHFRVQNAAAGKIDSASQNTMLGYMAGHKTTGQNNTVMGYNALRSNVAGYGNTAIGSRTLHSNTSGYFNCAYGHVSMYANTTGSTNTAMGMYSLYSNANGQSNVAMGYASLFANNSGSYNTGVGTYALGDNMNGTFNTALGYTALKANTSGTHNTALGSKALEVNFSGNYNSAIGFGALSLNTVGFSNTASGVDAMRSNTSGSNNTASGVHAMFYNTSGGNNSAFGYDALKSNSTGVFNVAVGASSLNFNTTGVFNTAVGSLALGLNNTGVWNTALGYNSLGANTTGSQNTAVGLNALLSTSASSFNTAVGQDAARYYNLGWNNTFVGANSGCNSDGLYNTVAIGNGTLITASSQARIGNAATSSIGGYANWTNISDGRYKKNISEEVLGLDFIMRLRPVTYQLDVTHLRQKMKEPSAFLRESGMETAITEKEQLIQSGFIAQEVESVALELGYDFSGVDKPKNENDLYGLRYAEFVVPLTKAIQEQQLHINELRTELAALKARTERFEAQVHNAHE